MFLVKVRVTGWTRCRWGPSEGSHWKLGEVVYWKLEAVNHGTYNEDNRRIAGDDKSPMRGIMELPGRSKSPQQGII